ncbi:toll/interleukin-1 receptor domain-containing protein [Epilithonimonas sp. JDS]|uniref:TIR domain-containing protein n=1 Tax=Epilithonimonas sp. JDS TaxID=2902797 RepID=UPI001E3DDB1A|nr:TIR domain-containing protein [Epilithonimonas sp. JDS]MCD9855837.1 toll/interleukin-1 receptor domain-containing protein [Epilithonimonas sp. JDS]
MKVFLSWSGELSHKVALELREWLPFVIQSVEPYVSSEDIDKGVRWSIDIAKELEDSSFGILCVTPQNIDAPWLNFEAGALSKAFSTSNVSPFLFGLKPSDLKKSPLLQFQSTLYEKKDLLKLVLSINNALGKEKLDDNKLKPTFDVWYEKLKTKLDPLLSESSIRTDTNSSEVNENKANEAMEEILELTREQFKILRNPEMILPPQYISIILKEMNQNNSIDGRVMRDLEFGFRNLKMVISSIPEEATFENKDLESAITRLERAIIYIKENYKRNRPTNPYG